MSETQTAAAPAAPQFVEGQKVTFTVPTRSGKSAERTGTIAGRIQKSNGTFYSIHADGGVTVRTRPALIRAA